VEDVDLVGVFEGISVAMQWRQTSADLQQWPLLLGKKEQGGKGVIDGGRVRVSWIVWHGMVQ
jgi:hypothetical protein